MRSAILIAAFLVVGGMMPPVMNFRVGGMAQPAVAAEGQVPPRKAAPPSIPKPMPRPMTPDEIDALSQAYQAGKVSPRDMQARLYEHYRMLNDQRRSGAISPEEFNARSTGLTKEDPVKGR